MMREVLEDVESANKSAPLRINAPARGDWPRRYLNPLIKSQLGAEMMA